MNANKNFSQIFPHYHPAAVFLYIAAAVACTMLTLQPLYVAISFVIGSFYSIYLNGWKKYWFGLRWLLMMFFIIAAVTPITNHRGRTVLFYLFGEKFTGEALLYGVCTGGMFVCMFVWFQCYQRLITADKFMYLFGRIAPTLAMVVSMILRLVPVTGRKLHETADARKALGADAGVKNGAKISGILMSRCMEDSIDTADSMRARGYGSGKRTVFKAYKIKPADAASILLLSVLLILSLFGILILGKTFTFFPTAGGFFGAQTGGQMPGLLNIPDLSPPAYLYAAGYAAYAAMLLYPFILELRYLLRWR
ncbi:MAG: energy-coupling factor transporter transmembrane protein EcfT [Clostridiales Family XIII bacterium]|nr:energy-coupling factor transporter transmembrane protein EcfT [Clostridiales Family XIII bacterium]